MDMSEKRAEYYQPAPEGQYPQGGYAPQGGPPPPYPQAGYPQQSGYGGQAPPPGGVVYQQQPPTVVVAQPMASPPNDHLAYAICVTICCCLPFGIVSIIKSVECRDKSRIGDAAGANVASKEAKRWANIGLGIGICLNVIWIVIVIVYCVVIASGLWMHAN